MHETKADRLKVAYLYVCTNDIIDQIKWGHFVCIGSDSDCDHVDRCSCYLSCKVHIWLFYN